MTLFRDYIRLALGVRISYILVSIFAGLLLVNAQDNQQSFEDLVRGGTASLQAGNFDAAELAYRSALKMRPRDAHTWKALGVVFAAQGKHAQAAEPFQKACDYDPREPDACYYLARNHYLLNRFQESLALLDRIRGGKSRDWRIENARGLAQLALNKYQHAEEAFRDAMRLENGAASVEEKPAINLGSLYIRAGEPAKARETLRKVVVAVPSAARAWFELAKAQVQLEEIEDARQSLESAVRVRPGYAEAHLLLAKVYARLGRMEESRAQRAFGLASRR